jgi:predicted phosphodiesterase
MIRKIQYVSDIHLELLFKNSIKTINYLLQPKADILVLAGDIGNPFLTSYKNFLENISLKFKKTFIIAGNHEYYGNDIIETKKQINLITNDIENVSFLDNTYEDYNNYRFVGTTLWTNINKPAFLINDTKMIKNFDIPKYNQLHLEATDFLQKTFQECKNDNIEAIVITHHLPFYELTHPNYQNSFYVNYRQWFNANLDGLIIENKDSIAAWVYGHTHSESVQKHYDINFYCNPVGYMNENDVNNINKTFEIN